MHNSTTTSNGGGTTLNSIGIVSYIFCKGHNPAFQKRSINSSTCIALIFLFQLCWAYFDKAETRQTQTKSFSIIYRWHPLHWPVRFTYALTQITYFWTFSFNPPTQVLPKSALSHWLGRWRKHSLITMMQNIWQWSLRHLFLSKKMQDKASVTVKGFCNSINSTSHSQKACHRQAFSQDKAIILRLLRHEN